MKIRIALLDLNKGVKNQGFGNIKEIVERFVEQSKDVVEVATYEVRVKHQLPELEDFDICISSGGPGDPHEKGEWLDKYRNLLDKIWVHNKDNEVKKFMFLICHSYQLACIHWAVAEVNKRKSFSFGVLPMHKTNAGEKEYLFKNLPEPFYAVDSRAYQVIQPNKKRLEELGMEVCAIEKNRPHIPLERAIMAIRFSEEIFGTQFHPEANPYGFLENLKDPKIKADCIKTHGKEKYERIIDRLDDEDKIILTQKEIIPRFLERSAKRLQLEEAI